MSVVKVSNLHKSYGSAQVLSDVSFSLDRGQKAALVGENGSGKSTLLKIIAGIEEADAGSVTVSKNARIGYLPQDAEPADGVSIRQYLRNAAGIDALERKLAECNLRRPKGIGAQRCLELERAYQRLRGYAFDYRIRLMLSGFGLSRLSLEQSLDTLSSGQKTKVVLAGILLTGVDLLLLDEPTNNLDLPALIWLEDYLKKTKAAAIIVSHDRRFLDKTVRKIFEIDAHAHTFSIASGTYSDYLLMQSKLLARQKEEYRLQQEEIARLVDLANELRARSEKGSQWKGTDNDKFLRRFKQERAGRTGKAAKAVEKRIEHMNHVEKPVTPAPLHIPLAAEISAANCLIKASGLVAGYPDGFRVGPVSFEIPFGARMGIMGLNGSGKSTLLKTIAGLLPPLEGEVEVGRGLVLGNLMQEHETLDRTQTLLASVTGRTGMGLSETFSLLTKFNFSERQIKQPIADLSVGGRVRFLLALFSAMSVSALLLDEPTNHLDLEALEALEETLKTYAGTVILVSHDRHFLEKARLETVYMLSDGTFAKIPDYTAYVEKAEAHAQQLLRLW